MERKKVVGYKRVSSESQMDNTSIEDQENRIKMYCELHNYELVKIYSDEGISGSKTEIRDGYNEMIKFATNKENKISAVIANKIDRIHRSGKNLLIMVEDVLEPSGVAFVSITEQFDTSTPMGKLFLGMLGNFAEFERATINARTKGGRVATAKKHGHAGGAIAFGYTLVDKNSFTLVIDTNEAAIVKRIFQLKADRKSLGLIAAHLNSSNLLHNSKEWSRQSIDYVLKNETYIGKYTYNGKREKNAIEYNVPSIISKILWNKTR